MNRFVSEILFQVPILCIGTSNSIALTHQNAFDVEKSKSLSFGSQLHRLWIILNIDNS